MASKTILQTAIKKLKYNTNILLEKRRKCSSMEEINKINKQISQNESMILDYKYRIEHEKKF